MVQLVAIGLVGALGWYAWRALKNEMQRVDDRVSEARKKQETQTLELDPKTGRYRAADDSQDD